MVQGTPRGRVKNLNQKKKKKRLFIRHSNSLIAEALVRWGIWAGAGGGSGARIRE